MSRIATIVFLALVAVSSAFTSPAISVGASSKIATTPIRVTQFETEVETQIESAPLAPRERGVSVDQDGKSNVWAIEPKMMIDTKSNEEKTNGALIAVGGLAAFGVAAVGILSNLPDPNQF